MGKTAGVIITVGMAFGAMFGIGQALEGMGEKIGSSVTISTDSQSIEDALGIQ